LLAALALGVFVPAVLAAALVVVPLAPAALAGAGLAAPALAVVVLAAAVFAGADLAVLVLAVVVFTAPALAPAGLGAGDLPLVAAGAVLGLGGAFGLAVVPAVGAALALLALAAGLLLLSAPSTAGAPLAWAGALALLLALRVLTSVTWMVSPDVVATIRISGRSVLADAATGLMGMGRRGKALRAAQVSRGGGEGSRQERSGAGVGRSWIGAELQAWSPSGRRNPDEGTNQASIKPLGAAQAGTSAVNTAW